MEMIAAVSVRTFLWTVLMALMCGKCTTQTGLNMSKVWPLPFAVKL